MTVCDKYLYVQPWPVSLRKYVSLPRFVLVFNYQLISKQDFAAFAIQKLLLPPVRVSNVKKNPERDKSQVF